MIRKSEKEKHLRRILYRFNSDQPWQEYAFNRVTFSHLIAVITLEVAKTQGGTFFSISWGRK